MFSKKQCLFSQIHHRVLGWKKRSKSFHFFIWIGHNSPSFLWQNLGVLFSQKPSPFEGCAKFFCTFAWLDFWKKSDSEHEFWANCYTQSLKSPHSIRGTIICMGRRGGMKSPKSPLNIPKTTGTPIQIQTHILIELGLNIMKSYCGRNIKTSIVCQKKDAFFPKSYCDTVCNVSKVSWGCGFWGRFPWSLTSHLRWPTTRLLWIWSPSVFESSPHLPPPNE